MAIYELDGVKPEYDPANSWVAPDAAVMGRVRLKADASVWFNAVLRGDNELIEIGERSNIQDMSVLHTDPGLPLVVGARVTVGHSVTLHGCVIGEGSLIGIGSTVLNGAKIGAGSIVAAGALVPEGKAFPDGALLMGAPAKHVRDVTPEQRELIGLSCEVYVDNWKRFARGLKRID